MAGPVLLSGGNPQISKGFGEAPVAAYLDAVPGWKNAVCRRLDALIMQAVPPAKKAVKWNTPMYGVEEGRWFTAFHCFDRYVKVSFFQGADMDPVPPEPSKMGKVRYLHVPETGIADEARLIDWFQQAARLPGEKM